MARNEAEKRRIMEEEDRELVLPWMTRGELNRLSPRQRMHEYQKFTQPVMTYLGRHEACKLPSCRRARACKGFISKVDIITRSRRVSARARSPTIRRWPPWTSSTADLDHPMTHPNMPAERQIVLRIAMKPPDPVLQIGILSTCSWMEQKIFAFAAFDGSFLSSQRAYFLRSPHQLIRWRIPK